MHLMKTGLVLISMCSFLGCETVSTTSSRSTPMPPDPVKAPSTPASSPITNVVVICPYALNDLNGDGRNAEFPLAVYLYAQPYPAPKWENGTCVMRLYPMGALRQEDPEGTILGEWRWDTNEVFAAREQNLVGDFYRFEVDLADHGLQDVSDGGFDFQVVFVSDGDGMPCTSNVKTVRMR